MIHKNIHSGFTLIELLVSITIFGVMMISVMSIFLFSSQMSGRVELNRVMQENIKNVLEDIAENVRKNGIDGVYGGGVNPDECSSSGATVSSTKLCLEGGSRYVLGTYDRSQSDPALRGSVISNIGDCQDYAEGNDTICRILKKDPGGDYYPLTNSFIAFENMSFVITNLNAPKLSINITARPSFTKGLSSTVMEKSIIHIQTTISERLIETH